MYTLHMHVCITALSVITKYWQQIIDKNYTLAYQHNRIFNMQAESI